MSQIKPGTKFRVPTEQQFLDAGWIYSPYDSTLLSSPKMGFIHRGAIAEFGGQIMTVQCMVSFNQATIKEDPYYLSSDTPWLFPVQACLDICGPMEKDEPGNKGIDWVYDNVVSGSSYALTAEYLAQFALEPVSLLQVLKTAPVQTPRKCTCGVASIGGGRHSDWCDVK